MSFSSLINNDRDIIAHADELKSKRNSVSQQVGQMKKSGQDATEIIAEMKRVGDEIAEYDAKLRTIEEEIDTILRFIPNLPHSSVPVGKSAEENVEVRRWLPDGFKFENDFKPMDHVELGKKLNILDFERGAKISGSGFPVYKGKGATLERSLINFMLDYHLQNHNYSGNISTISCKQRINARNWTASQDGRRYVQHRKRWFVSNSNC